jgi:hypothetical protein
MVLKNTLVTPIFLFKEGKVEQFPVTNDNSGI